jgi:hypothetical protein
VESDAPSPAPEPEEEPVPDESTLLGRSGVQDEVLAELARAEAEMSGAADEAESDATGTQV